MPAKKSTSKPKRPAKQNAGGGCSGASCSRDLPFDSPTPHAAIEAVITWLGIGYESTITRKSDGKKITIRITSENVDVMAHPLAGANVDRGVGGVAGWKH